VVTASEDKTARVWEADTGKPVGAPLQHQRAVYSVAFSPDGRRVVTASEDKTARVWEADTGKPVGAFLQHQGAVTSAAFSPDGRRVVTASSDTARVWTVLLGADSREDTSLMADFAEALGGYHVNEFGSLVPLENQVERMNDLRRRLAQAPDQEGSLTGFLRRFLSIR
jgi:WD40 repeat protein